MMKKNSKKSTGFTIIELLIVIAIIAVLAAIVMMNVVQYIVKGKDTAIKGNMASLLGSASVFYESQNSYAGFDSDPSYANAVAAITNANGTVTKNISPDGSAWCVYSTLNEGGIWCVDNTGYKGYLADGACADTNYSCQAP